MIIAKVLGPVVATAKDPHYKGQKILKVQPLRPDRSPIPGSAPIVALETVDAGVGDCVLVSQEGKWAREEVGDLAAPVRSMIIAVVADIQFAPQTGHSLPE